ncbi:MAG: hypothetical protein H2172_12285 [Opitutus sp.]|nr:hypothetical protein [Opitutus sp.]MCS6248197.1 hypothetical protein [Opitutus sp.]MCS6275659.1 hypothetical protein [Opitutus sp.]MCS6299826.1 hypothetical protein [Opitutus sp.]
MSLTVAPNVDFTSAPSQAAFKTALNTLLNEMRTNGAALGDIRGIKNSFINAAMRVDWRNRGSAQTITAGAALAYTVDRWYAYCTGANVTGQQITASGQKRYRFTGAASVTGVGFAQRIAAENSAHLASTTATVQVKLASSSLTSIGWAAYYANTTDTFGTLASPTRTSIASGTFTINSTEATYSAQISVPSGAITGIEIVFTGGALLGSQTLTIGDAQLEAGASLTPFDRIPLTADIAACSYYLPVINFGGYGFTGQAYSASSTRTWVAFPFPARVAPTGCSSLTGLTASAANLASAGGTPTFASATTSGASIDVSGASGLTLGYASALQGTANVHFNGCEL